MLVQAPAEEWREEAFAPANDAAPVEDAAPAETDAPAIDYPDHAYEYEGTLFDAEMVDDVFTIVSEPTLEIDAAAPEEDDAPPFDPPEAHDLDPGFQRVCADDEADDAALLLSNDTDAREPLRAASPSEEGPRLRAAPPIVIHASWDRPEVAAVLHAFAADRLLSRAEIEIGRGGVDGAALHAGAGERPDLVIVDSTLSGAQLLHGLDRLKRAAGPEVKIIVIGALNDIALLRELNARGVTQYIVAPTGPAELVRSVCTLYADVDKSRIIAVMGVRGGVGASTIAYNLAWSIAERQRARVSLVDFDLAFGAAAFTRQREAPHSLSELLVAADDDDEALERVALKVRDRLQIVPAPASLAATEFGIAPFERVLGCVRRANPYVVLDLPHMWSPWIRHALERADEVVLVAGPELASLRNADNILKLVQDDRRQRSAPSVLLSQTGMPKRPEIPLRDFTDALRAAPVGVIPFDPALFGAAAMAGRALGEIEPAAKTAKLLDQFAWSLTGRDPNDVRRIASRAPEVWTASAEAEAPVVSVESTPEAPADEPPSDAAPLDAPDAENEPVAVSEAAPALAEPCDAEPESPDVAAQAPLLCADYVERARLAMQAEVEAAHTPRRRSRWRRGAVALGFVVLGAALFSGALRFRDLGQASAAPQVATAAVAAPQLEPGAEYETALRLMAASETDAALAHMRRAADAGHGEAQHRLAQMYERGEGVAPNITLARQWTERAAASGASRAMHDLGVYYARGEGGAQDDAAAFRWFRQAAEFGVADSQYNLGVLYAQGRGVTTEPGEALFWFILATEQGDESARERVRVAEETMTPFEIEQARVRAQAFGARYRAAPGEAPAEGPVTIVPTEG